MLPAHLADNIRKQILFYLQATFDFRDDRVESAFQDFVLDPENGLFKGPWVQLRRPFTPANGRGDPPFAFKPPFEPFAHQAQSWQRLSSRDSVSQSTIITTGTGSGKTECFLFPILDHCLRMTEEGQKGIKAIVLYPMNALAADQEKRFAKTIWSNPVLRQAGLRVGNYTGRFDPSDPAGSKDSGDKAMGEDHGITHHGSQLASPPDVLLTNYKMLDFLLMRPQDQELWRHNEPGVLRYLVLDELHTYDGAQGADVACLIRRLKERLGVEPGSLCAVGTSATLHQDEDSSESFGGGLSGADQSAEERLSDFASKLFEEQIGPDAVIGESRLSVDEIVAPDPVDVNLPSPDDCDARPGESAPKYARRQADVWGVDLDPNGSEGLETEDELHIGDWLKTKKIFSHLLHIFAEAEKDREGPLTWERLVRELTVAEPELDEYRHEDRKRDRRSEILFSLLALVAHAKELRSGEAQPLVPTQVQLWVRELRRLGRVVDEEPEFSWLDEPAENAPSLPVVHCSECGESGWLGVHNPAKDALVQSKGGLFQLKSAPEDIYREWFAGRRRQQHGQSIVVLVPLRQGDDEKQAGDQLVLESEDLYLYPQSLVIGKAKGSAKDRNECPLTGDARSIRVQISNQTEPGEKGGVVGVQRCPRCESRESLLIIGSQAATLSSLAIDEMFGSILNSDPKLLAFTDSVQDASHRAGFFSARTFNFTFRTALQHVIDESGAAGLPLPDAGRRILEWASAPVDGRPGSIKEAIAALLPPDLLQLREYQEFRNGPSDVAPTKLLSGVETRLTWQATSEFGLMQLRGRTLETNMCSALAWDEERINATLREILDCREKFQSALLKSLPDFKWRVWFYGLLHHYRLRGALEHPYVVTNAGSGAGWGKTGFGRRLIPGREMHPPTGRFRPRLLVDQPEKHHDYLLHPSQGGRPPWPIHWTRLALASGLDEAVVLDLLREFLTQGAATGLLRVVRKDGNKSWYAIAADAARLIAEGASAVQCNDTKRYLFRPTVESKLWKSSASLEYRAQPGSKYLPAPSKRRHHYYQKRYRNGALRRVMAHEHTGLLKTSKREEVERRFAATHDKHEDDPNVLTCTSTLEMGIDIGDLSSTMLCAIPPSTANYIQRIGRAGRATGTALVVSVVNQKPHDLFFYARPGEMIRGAVEPPGCWLDASAVLVRHYLGYCFDTTAKEGVLTELPRTGGQLFDDMEDPEGRLSRMFRWVGEHEEELRDRFLARFGKDIEDDTRERFIDQTASDGLRSEVHRVAKGFDRTRRDLENARKRLRHRLKELSKVDPSDKDAQEARDEIEREIKILRARSSVHSRKQALELLTDHGLLPNYAFPERGVPFYGLVYNRQDTGQSPEEPVELIRPAAAALSELAPANHFYTHSRRFTIQQLAVGNEEDPLIKKWAICGSCGHLREVRDLKQPGSGSACPQCGHDGDEKCQFDQGQHRDFLEFSSSQASSFMEHFESLSADRDEDRQREAYQKPVKSFDTTVEAPSGAVLEDDLPFGIEFLSAAVMREVNTGFYKDPVQVPFGAGRKVPEEGFRLCASCGVALVPGERFDKLEIHRRNCSIRRAAEELKQKDKSKYFSSYDWRSVYLYRELRSEAIRLLLPLTDDADLDTLTACIYLGLRLRFGGDPHHLVVAPHIIPKDGVRRHYLILLDGVPGGTGYLKALYQQRDAEDRPGEGILDVLRRACEALKTCRCRRVRSDQRRESDGCYRCIRAYHLQYRADRISRERGIQLLEDLLRAGAKRQEASALSEISYTALYDSLLEKKLVDALRSYVEHKEGLFEKTLIRGATGFRFMLPSSNRIWELELQPYLGKVDGVMVDCQPDFVLRCDDDAVLPVAIFTDGFAYHCHPPNNILESDFRKRRAILASGNFHVWSISWDDLDDVPSQEVMACHDVAAQYLVKWSKLPANHGLGLPDASSAVRGGLRQLRAFLENPSATGWQWVASFTSFWLLQQTVTKRSVPGAELEETLGRWRQGDEYALAGLVPTDDGDQVYGLLLPESDDVISMESVADVMSNNVRDVRVLARLDDSDEATSEAGYKERWRRFLVCLNLYQFCGSFSFWTTKMAAADEAPDLPVLAPAPALTLSDSWEEIVNEVAPSLSSLVRELAPCGVPVPQVEHYNDNIDDDAFAELAWPDVSPPVAVLAGDQEGFSDTWERQGWTVVLGSELRVEGIGTLIEHLDQYLSDGA